MIDIFECFPVNIDDNLLSRAKIAVWMFNQQLETPKGEKKPFAPKAFPDKAIDILIDSSDDGKIDQLEIYFDPEKMVWNSRIVKDGRFGKLSDEQLDRFFQTNFYKRMVAAIEKKWPLSDPHYGEMFQAIKSMDIGFDISDEEMEEMNELESRLEEVDQTEKKPELANKDTSGDGKRDYSGTGRKIQNFSDMGVKGGSGRYFCWPRPGKEFKWNTWKDWHKLKPFCKMTFVHNGRKYMISLSLFDEEFDNRGFRGADTQWTPPLAWLTHEECSQVLQLTIVKRFLKQCQKRVKEYLDMNPEEVYEKIDKKERVTPKEIEKTQRVIKHCIKVAFRDRQADNYHYDNR